MGHVNFFLFPYHIITLFENKYGIYKLYYFNFHVPFKTSCELASSIKIKMQVTKLLHFDDTVTYFDKIVVMFSHRGSK